ncbi:MAG TPA: FUSC family membrane protein [Buttiauxella sp.]|uniref:FUSC family protein n=1 Tax=Buttiauxella sp. TaxID=1972222 RepID=UPI002B496130|nr:FUSC family membrane protein [Buttiauxella sp.]HKM98537.1 FUSC family membrane protein [Buttiauxella sp.]
MNMPIVFKRFFNTLPAYAINGVSTALGIGLVQLLVGAWAGEAAALAASSGAIYASLADFPTMSDRAWRRILLSAIIGCVSAFLVMVLQPFPIALGLLTATLGFVLAMTLVWGPRAGPHSFVGILALVFTMGAPPVTDTWVMVELAGKTVLGAAFYFCWAMGISWLFRQRYRRLALAEAMTATALLLRGVAHHVSTSPKLQSDLQLRALITLETALAERLQAARDFIFPAPASEEVRRQTGTLLHLLDLRDTVLASQLDLGSLPDDASGTPLRAALAVHLAGIAARLDEVAEAVRFNLSLPDSKTQPHQDWVGLDTLCKLETLHAAGGHALLPTLLGHARQMSGEVTQLRAWLRGDVAGVAMAPHELRLFVSPEGWPLAALRAHAHLESPILRHAIRVGLALGCAYFIALHLPWSSHPHWLVLSVAVVLRGNLEQTLSRRNIRVLGTVLGCVLTVVLMQLHWPWFSALTFLVAVGLAHTYFIVRYLVTAIAATVMALLQIHVSDVGTGLAIAERLADTLLGGALAWGFSYVLPFWERRSLPLAVNRMKQSLQQFGEQVMRRPEADVSDLALRLARREAYDTIIALAGVAQRTIAEPKQVQLPMEKLADLIVQARLLLANLASTHLLLTRCAAEPDRTDMQALLEDASHQLQQLFATQGTRQPAENLTAEQPLAEGENDNTIPPAGALLPWLQRRLDRSQRAAQHLVHLADRLQA